MAEYIGRETFLKDIEDRYCLPCKEAGKDHNGCMCRACWVDDMRGEVIDAPAADVAPVVRCKDCKHHYDCGIHFCDRLGMDCPDDSDFFCSYGVRKDGGVERLLSTSTW